MKERPIIMTGDSPKAILEDRKTQTRRVVKIPKQARIKSGTIGYAQLCYDTSGLAEFKHMTCPYGKVGDRLWLKETLYIDGTGFCRYGRDVTGLCVRATHPVGFNKSGKKDRIIPSIFMPRWASRILLEITGVRVERLQEISRDDVLAEGIFPFPYHNTGDFEDLWDSLNAKRGYGWEINPWVWVISFRRVE